MVSSTHPEHHLVGVCNESRSPSAYWPATAIRYCADQTPEVVWPRGPGRQVSRSFPCSRSLHIACPKELEAASRSSKTHLAKNGGPWRKICANLILASRQGFGKLKTEQLGGHSQEQQRHRQVPIDDDDDDLTIQRVNGGHGTHIYNSYHVLGHA